ncbi:sigma-70 family RNA polymerase sigma factor [Candidatus Pelagibacter sp. HIMB1748]|jgi:RNA polymerase sigma-70 factor (ECF subfamily)|uniref:sigma-70 family RNA polymerase sigma factor n=1 Tax=unclassified Candidatus Pelagibacter TaxID=2647897 RepID=UPI003F829B4B
MSYDSESDYILLKEIQKGNHSAFSKLVNIYTTRFYSMAYRYLNNQQDAEDIVQKAFLKLWKNPYSWTPGKAKFTTWFSRVIINLCLDQLKKRKLVSISENFEFMDQSTLQIEKIIKEERNILVQKAIQQLPTRQKTALILCFLEGYSNKEVATILETTEKAVQSLLLRAKDFLKRQIDITKL